MIPSCVVNCFLNYIFCYTPDVFSTSYILGPKQCCKSFKFRLGFQGLIPITYMVTFAAPFCHSDRKVDLVCYTEARVLLIMHQKINVDVEKQTQDYLKYFGHLHLFTVCNFHKDSYYVRSVTFLCGRYLDTLKQGKLFLHRKTSHVGVLHL